MAFIGNKKYKDIMNAYKGGNEKAKKIIDEYMSLGQDDLDRLVNDFYLPNGGGIAVTTTQVNDEEPQTEVELKDSPVGDTLTEAVEEAAPEVEHDDDSIAMNPTDVAQEPDAAYDELKKHLDEDMDGLIDDDDFPEVSFSDYLKDKKKNKNRAAKGHDHFVAYDPAGRSRYIEDKMNDYQDSFLLKLRDMMRDRDDRDYAISVRSQSLNDLPDDGIELDLGNADKAYDELTGDDKTMHAFGRFWDQDDNDFVNEIIMALAKKYGRKSVLAALNTLKDDNYGYTAHKAQQVDQSVKNRRKKLEELLK